VPRFKKYSYSLIAGHHLIDFPSRAAAVCTLSKLLISDGKLPLTVCATLQSLQQHLTLLPVLILSLKLAI
jgi:hypothetical protein